MSTNHAPGPWQTSLSDDTVVIHVGADGIHYQVATIDGDYNEPDLWPVMEANARLIAAAPDLLAQLREVVDFADSLGRSRWSEYEGDIDADLALARAAIDRATGAA